METQPLTVLLPARDAQRTLALALSDLLHAMDPRDELLVIDDGSIDQTPGILTSFRSRDSRIRVLRTPGTGLVGALNLGLREASNEWIARADADDRYPESRLANQRAVRSEGVCLITGDYRIRSHEGPVTLIPCALSHPLVALSLLNPQRIPHPGVLYSRSAVLDAGGYREADFPAEDLALWMRMSVQGQMVGVPDVVVDWMLNPKSVSQSQAASQVAKTQMLLRNYRFPLVREVTQETLLEELRRYEVVPNAPERRLLLLRDLRTLNSQDMASVDIRGVLRSIAADPINSIVGASRLWTQARRRRAARRGLQRMAPR